MNDKKYPIGGYAPGNYHCKCCDCGNGFIGDKRAVQCEPCAVSAQERYTAMSPEERTAHDKKVVEAMKEVMKKFNTTP